jgi:hypothetical protein
MNEDISDGKPCCMKNINHCGDSCGIDRILDEGLFGEKILEKFREALNIIERHFGRGWCVGTR